MPRAGADEYVSRMPIAKLTDGTQVEIRPIRPTDIELEREFIASLSPESRRYRFLYTIGTPSESLLRRLTHLDEERDAALIALHGSGSAQKEIGVARFSATPDGLAEVAVTVADAWRLRGVGTVLVRQLIEIARSRGIKALFSIDPADNDSMRRFARALGFARTPNPDDATQVIHTLEIQPIGLSSTP